MHYCALLMMVDTHSAEGSGGDTGSSISLRQLKIGEKKEDRSPAKVNEMFFDVDRSTWPTPNYVDPPVAGHWLMFIEYALMGLSTIVVGLRMITRGYVLSSLGWDDFCAIMSWAFAVILTAANIVLIDTGYGRHIWDVVPDKRRQLLLNVWLYQWVAAVSTGFSKMSILYFLLRFIDGKWARRSVHATMLYVVAWSLTCACVWMFRCIPVATWWNEEIPEHGKCMTTEWFLKATGIQSAFGALSHTIILFLPISTLWKLNLSKWKKAWFVFVLWMGGTCCAFASGRLYYTVIGVRKQDMTYYGYSALLFQALEVQTQVFYTCTPFLGPTAQAMSRPVIQGIKKISGSAFTTPATSQTRSNSHSVMRTLHGRDATAAQAMQDLEAFSAQQEKHSRQEKQGKQAVEPVIVARPVDIESAPASPSPIRTLPRAARVGSFPETANSSSSSLAAPDDETGSQGLSPPTPPRSSM